MKKYEMMSLARICGGGVKSSDNRIVAISVKEVVTC